MARCPQCRTVIYVRKRKSRFVEVRDSVEAIERSGLQLAMMSAITGAVASAVYTTFYAIGVASIRCVCPTDMALKVLGIRTTPTTIEMEALTLRRMVFIPWIPCAIFACGSRGPAADAATAFIPLAMIDTAHPPWKLRGPRLVIALIPLARLAYFALYDAIVDPIIQVCASQVRPSIAAGDEDDNEDPLIDVRIRVDNIVEDVIAEPAEDRVDVNDALQEAAPVAEIANVAENAANENNDNVDALVQPAFPDHDHDHDQNQDQDQDQQEDRDEDEGNGPHRHRGRHGLVWMIMEPLINLLARGDDADANLMEPGGVPQANDWIISKRSTVRRLGRVILLPALSGVVGSLLSMSPLVRRLVPSRFYRNLLGGATVVLIRDVVNVVTALLRVSQENSRHVLNYYEVDQLPLSERTGL